MIRAYEPLHISAPLARVLAGEHCHTSGADAAGCDWYHGSWQFFRLLGLINTIGTDDDFFYRVLPRYCRHAECRVLISGAADYALLARIVALTADARAAFPRVTVMDRCLSPLLLNRWYASETGVDITVRHEDILHAVPGPKYDLICTHSFLGFFDAADRERLVANWYDMLKPGGVIVTAQRVRPGENRYRVGYPPDQIAQFTVRARELAVRHYDTLGLDPDLAEHVALSYVTRYKTHAIRSVDELQCLFLNAGFGMEEFAPPRSADIPDLPGAPRDVISCRWRIVVWKPVDSAVCGGGI
jgi:SAM-dependent methyltransferase